MYSSLLQGSSNKRVSWSDLPPELLHLISLKLTDISDYIRFRGVSRSCRSSAPTDMSPKLPWLMLPADPHSPTRSFFSLHAKKVYTLPVPELSDKVVCGSSYGWLVVLDVVNPKSATAFLFNPVTRAKIQLPPPVDLPRQLGLRVEKLEAEQYMIHREQAEAELPEHLSQLVEKAYIEHATLSSNLSSTPMVLAVLHDSQKFAFCRPGDGDWTVLDSKLPQPVATIVYRETRFYIVDKQGNTAVFSHATGITTLSHSLEIPANAGLVSPVLESPNGALQLVVCTFLFNEERQGILRFGIRIFGLDIEKLKLSETTSTDNNHAIFVTFRACKPTGSSYPGFTENCIYFPSYFEVRSAPNRSCFDIEPRTPNLAIYQYSINDNQVTKHLLSDWKHPDSRLFTKSWWVTPTL